MGVPYHAGGTSPATGFDCSGFTQWVCWQHGIFLPRQSFEQYQVGQPVRGDQLQQGDLVFFEIEQKGASHVGIYEARGWFIHCSSPGGRVREDHLSEKYWRKHYLGARRPQF
jgi:cell wall-associated NlpC family hydrolase